MDSREEGAAEDIQGNRKEQREPERKLSGASEEISKLEI